MAATRPPWHYASISRHESELVVANAPRNGSFLVRDSESVRGACVLSVSCDYKVHNYRLTILDDGRVIMEGGMGKHDNLLAMVEYYSSPDSPSQLVTVLTDPILPSVFLAVEEEEEEEEGDEEGGAAYSRVSAPGEVKQSELPATLRPIFETLNSLPAEPQYDAMDKRLRDYMASQRHADTVVHAEMLSHLFGASTKSLLAEVQRFADGLDRLRTVFSRAGALQGIHLQNTAPLPQCGELAGADDISKRLFAAAALVKEVQSHGTRYCNAMDIPKEEIHAHSKVFSVKKVEKLLSKDTRLKVNVTAGTIVTGHGKGESEDDKVYKYDEVMQVIKSRSNKTRLGVQFKGKKRKDYSFNDVQEREDFCQMVQMIRNRFEESAILSGTHVSKVSVFIGTFNMGEEGAPPNLESWFACQGSGHTLPQRQRHDIYAIGTQESGGSEKDWLTELKRLIGDDYYQVGYGKLLQMRLVVFAASAVKSRISHVQTSTVATGIANKVGNKGGVGISFFVGGSSICFINSHLAANAEKCRRRNQNFRDILAKMQLGQKKLVSFDITNQFDHLFWFGDLNYRLDMHVDTALECIKDKKWDVLRTKDQLMNERARNTVFFGFEEGEINFAPTYRYKRGQRDIYEYEKQKAGYIRINVPSWCDRVLWKSFPNAYIKQLSYGCTDDVVTSDHSPVFATFEVGVHNQYVSQHAAKAPEPGQECRILFHAVNATIQSASSTRFALEFFAPFVDGKPRSELNRAFEAGAPVWSTADLPVISPVIPDRRYLEMEHLLVSVKSEDSDESYGEGCIALRNLFGDEPMSFRCHLTHRGDHTGELFGFVEILNSVGEGSSSDSLVSTTDFGDRHPSRDSIASLGPIGSRSQSFDNVARPGPRPSAQATRNRDSKYRPAMPLPGSSAGPAVAPKPAARPRSAIVSSVGIAEKPAAAAAAPALPPRKSSYSTPTPPTPPTPPTVAAFLRGIGLGDKTDKFVADGWDDVAFLGDLDEASLADLGCTPEETQTVLAELQRMAAP